MGNRADLPISNRTVIDADHGRDLRSSSTEEHFAGRIKFGANNDSFLRGIAQLTPAKLDDSITGDTEQNILCGGGSNKFVIDDQKEIFRAALRDVALLGKHNRLVKAILHCFSFSKGCINIAATD